MLCEGQLKKFYLKKFNRIMKKVIVGGEVMRVDEYQQMALETAIYPEQFKVIYPALGMAGEAGEVADKVKKIIRDSNGEVTKEKGLEIAKEIGDVLWYCATLSNDLGFKLSEIAQMNYDKLHSRQQRGKLGGSGDNR